MAGSSPAMTGGNRHSLLAPSGAPWNDTSYVFNSTVLNSAGKITSSNSTSSE